MKHLLQLTTTLILLLFLSGNAWGQTTLSPGDIAITGVNMDNPDEISVVFLVDIESGTEIKFTDNGWLADNSWRTGEGIHTWTASQAYSAGNEIVITLDGPALASSGDQIIAYQNTSDMVAAINDEGAHVWQADATSSNTSALPQGLTNGTNCVALDETDNIMYDRSTTSGTKEEILSAINDYTKWSGSDAIRQTLSTAGFTITGGSSPTITLSTSTLTGFTYLVGNGPSAEQSFTVEGSNLTADISIAATTNYEISTGTGGSFSATNPVVLTESGGAVATTTIYVRLKEGLSVADYNNEDITATSSDAVDKTVTCSGSVTAPPPPTITLSETTLSDFTYLVGNGPSAEQSFTAEGSNLTADISIAATTNYEISTGTGGSFSATNPITLTESGGAVATTTIYVRLKAGLSVGNYDSENITATSTDADNKTVTCSGSVVEPATTTLPYNETFDADLGDCYTNSVAGTNVWYHNGTDGRAEANGYNGDNPEEDWLILPGIDFTAYTNEIMSFTTYAKYGTNDANNYLKLFYSTDYAGLGDPSSSNWTELDYTQPTGINTSTEVSAISGNIDLSGIDNSNVFIAFKYYSTDSPTRWAVDNIFIGTAEPTNHPTSFTATANSSTEITTSWTDAVAGDQAPSGYLVLANITGTFSDPVDGMAQTDDTDMSDDIGVKNIGTGVETFQWTGLDAATQYFFKIFPYNGSDAMINYKTDPTGPTADATTESNNDNDSEVDGPVTASQPDPSLISSLVDTDGEAVRVFDMDVWDYGSSDGLATKITQLTIKSGTNNESDWSNEIQAVKLSTDGGSTFVTIGSPTINVSSIVIPITSGNLDIADGEAETVSLYIYLNNSGLTDNAVFEFMIDKDDHGFLTDASGSAFSTTFSNNTISNEILLDVELSEIRFTQQPSNVNLGEVMSPAVTIDITDENGNIDFDANGSDYSVGLTTIGSFDASATTSADAVSGIVTFDNLIFNTESTGTTITTTDPDGWGWSNKTSDAFSVINSSSTGSVIISEMCDPYSDYAINRYIEITNIDNMIIDLSGWTLDAIINDGSSVAFTWTLSGTIAPNESLTFGDSDNSVFTPDFSEADWSTSNSSWNGKTGDGAKLYNGSKAIVDDAGAHGNFENKATIRLLSVYQPTTTFSSSEWFSTGVDSPAESTPGYHINVWTGNTDESWTETGNWSQGVTTKELCHAVIPSSASNMPTISSKATGDVHDIKLEEDATLKGQENLTVNGTAFVNKSFTSYSTPNSKDGWYAVSPPVNGMTIAGSNFEPVEDEDDFYVYGEATNHWLNYYDNENPASLFDEFDPATGYLVGYHSNNAGLKSFAGDLNANASYAPSLSNANTSWNLVGNPYCSYVTWADVANTDVSSPKSLNNTNGAWEDLETTVSVGEGIFVYAESGSAALTFELADQSHASTKKSGEYTGFVKLLAGFNENLTVQLLLQANDDATQDYEWKYDARYFYPVTSIPYLCAVTNDDIWVSKYVFDSDTETTIIPVRFTVQEEQQITFSVENFDTNLGVSKLTIEDTELNEFVVLSDGNTYEFTATPNDDPLRFKLHAEAGTGIQEATIEGLNIYTHANILYLNSDLARNASVEMYNVTGQKVFGKNVTLDGLTQINPQLTTGWYVVKVSTGEGIATEKVFIK